MRIVVCVAAALMLAACSSSKFLVRQVAEPEKPGAVAPLADLVQHVDNGVVVVFVHWRCRSLSRIRA